MTTIVFSKDRSLQLDAFLRSYQEQVTPNSMVDVLYLATSERHLDAYSQVLARYSWVRGLRQTGRFRDHLLTLLPIEGAVIFFVDDQVFVRPWTVLAMPGLSLRLGLNLTSNYMSWDAPQTLPPFVDAGDGLLTWLWADGQLAWRYPLSLDGHVLDVADIRGFIESVDFHSPNTFEAALQTLLPVFLSKSGVCYRSSKVVNIPWTRVQVDYDANRYDSQHSPEDLLGFWESGQQIDVRGLYGVMNVSVHQEFPLMLEARV